MKKILMLTLLFVFATAIVFAGSLDFDLKGSAGMDGSGNKGALIGGCAGVVYHLNDHFGIAVEANACGANLTFNNGVVLKDNLFVSVPVMAWFSTTTKNKIELGAGAGIAPTFRKISVSFDVAGGAKLTYWINSIGLTAGVTGTLDCFPKIKCVENEDGSKTYSFQNTDWIDNSFLVSLGVSYHFDLND